MTNPSKTDYLDLGGAKITGITKSQAVVCADVVALVPVLPPEGSAWIQFNCRSFGLKVESFTNISSYGAQTSLRISNESFSALIPTVGVVSSVRSAMNQYEVTYTVKNNMQTNTLGRNSFAYITFFDSKGIPVWMDLTTTNVALLPSGSHTFTFRTTTMSSAAFSRVVSSQVYVVPG